MIEQQKKNTTEVSSNLYTKMLKLSNLMHSYEWEKDGKNMHQQYKYVSESQYKNNFKKALDTVGLVWESNCISYEFIPQISDKMHLVLATFKATITDPETKETKDYTFVGSGSDNGDKALYKAYTGGLKFFLANTFLVAENNDPENDEGNHEAIKVEITSKKKQMITPQQRVDIKKELTNSSGPITSLQVNSIRSGIVKLRSFYMNDNKEIINPALREELEPFIQAITSKVRHGITKSIAEELLVKIRDKMNELM